MYSFDIDKLFFRFRYPLLIFFVGLILVGFGVFITKSGALLPETKIEVLDGATEGQETGEITAEISGAVMIPGVYKLSNGARIEDLLIKAGGFSGEADRVWTDKYLNRAAKITDGQKVYIPKKDQQSNALGAKTGGGDQTISSDFSSDSKAMININTASLSQLDSLPGIGQVYGQNIIEHRPYSNVEELLSKGVLKESVYNKIKNLITIY
jgi:competence protein ComEA